MTIENIVKTSISLVNPSDFATFADVRKRVLKGHTPAPTLVYMSAIVCLPARSTARITSICQRVRAIT